MSRRNVIHDQLLNALIIAIFVFVTAMHLYTIAWLMIFGLVFVKLRERIGAASGFVFALCTMWISQAICFLASDITRSNLGLSIILLNVPILFALSTTVFRLKNALHALFTLKFVAVLIAPASWILVQLFASQSHLNSFVSWAMSGDARNNAIFIVGLKSGSIDVTPFTLVSGGFTGISTSTLSEVQSSAPGFSQQVVSSVVYDIRNFWIFLILTISILIGLVTFRLVNEKSRLLSLMVTFGATLTIYSWSYLGRALEGGFLNSFVALTLILCAFVLWLEKNSGQIDCNSFMIGQSLVLLLVSITWAPLAVIPFGFLIWSITSLSWNLLKEISLLLKATALTLSLALLFASAWILLKSDIRALVGQVFRTEGGFYPFGHLTLFLLVLVIGLVSTISHLNTQAIREVFLSIAGVLIMLAILLWSRRDAAQMWGYYPLKFAWIVSMALFTLAIGLMASVIARSNRLFLLRFCAYVILFTLAAFGMKSDSQNLQGSSSPVWRVLSGWSAPNGEIVEELFYSKDFMQENTFFYRFADRESDRLGNFWAALLATNVSQAIHWAYLYDSTNPNSFCEIAGIEPQVLVVSVNALVMDELNKACLTSNYSIVFR